MQYGCIEHGGKSLEFQQSRKGKIEISISFCPVSFPHLIGQVLVFNNPSHQGCPNNPCYFPFCELRTKPIFCPSGFYVYKLSPEEVKVYIQKADI